MRIWKEEIFGPVATIATFRTDAEAIALANDTQYGLAAYLYSGSLSRALGIAERLEYGMVGINDTAISAAQAPFGGIKQSGFGREGSAHGIEDYLVLKYLSVA
jgi:succinate-semialdehyde dehydrogenase/glutarate-semialdehyde dehydrogenase